LKYRKIIGSVSHSLYKAVVVRDLHGIALLFQYYNHLYYVERRFFPPDRSLGIYFEW
jgi:hypothetical protein